MKHINVRLDVTQQQQTRSVQMIDSLTINSPQSLPFQPLIRISLFLSLSFSHSHLAHVEHILTSARTCDVAQGEREAIISLIKRVNVKVFIRNLIQNVILLCVCYIVIKTITQN